jgi:hypothetical protein
MIRTSKQFAFALFLVAASSFPFIPFILADEKDPDAKPATAEKPKAEPDAKPKDTTEPRKVMSLDAMLASALRHNPDVRSAEASVRKAEADLNRVKLQTVQNVIAFRGEWAEGWRRLENAESALVIDRKNQEVRAAAKGPKHIDSGVRPAEVNVVSAKERLAQIEIQLPFILGMPPEQGDASDTAPKKGETKQNDTLVKSREFLEACQKEFSSGRLNCTAMLAAYRQAVELEVRAASNLAERKAAIELHLKRLAKLHAEVKARLDEGLEGGSSADLASVEIEQASAQLWIGQLSGDYFKRDRDGDALRFWIEPLPGEKAK